MVQTICWEYRLNNFTYTHYLSHSVVTAAAAVIMGTDVNKADVASILLKLISEWRR